MRDFQVRIWGARGSLPLANPNRLRYGGNTACIEINVGGQVIIIDAGTGIHQLGRKLTSSGKEHTIHLLFSHLHYDHVLGFLFFEPAFQPGNILHLYGERKLGLSLREHLDRFMSAPFWPIGLDKMQAELNFHEIAADSTFTLPSDVSVSTFNGNHPNGTTLYRIKSGDRSVCYISDYEHGEQTDPGLIEFVKGTDVLIYDAAYTNSEYIGEQADKCRKGWGHSTWEEGCRLALLAKVKQLVLFHHDISRNDAQLFKIEEDAKRCFSETYAAYEGMVIHL